MYLGGLGWKCSLSATWDRASRNITHGLFNNQSTSFGVLIAYDQTHMPLLRPGNIPVFITVNMSDSNTLGTPVYRYIVFPLMLNGYKSAKTEPGIDTSRTDSVQMKWSEETLLAGMLMGVSHTNNIIDRSIELWKIMVESPCLECLDQLWWRMHFRNSMDLTYRVVKNTAYNEMVNFSMKNTMFNSVHYGQVIRRPLLWVILNSVADQLVYQT